MTKQWEELKQALKKPATPEAMAQAAQAFKRYRVVQLTKGKSSKPTLVSLAVPVDKIPDELAKNPEFYNLVKRIVTKEK
jgi:hypothetical protein